MKFDAQFARSQFPDFVWNQAFFENAGGTFVPKSVISRLTEYMTESQVQPGSKFSTSEIANNRTTQGHNLMARFLGVADEEVVISPSTSINVYVLAHALRHLWKENDEIIVSLLNHEANSGPWRRLEEFGLKIIEWPVEPETGEASYALLDKLLSNKTRLVAFPHVSNITGTINDVKLITEKVHNAGGLVCVDGVAYAPHRFIDVKKWNVDFYLFSFYKVFGPHLGCLYGKKKHLLEARGQNHFFINEQDTSLKLNPAGPNFELIASLVGITDYFEELASHHFTHSEKSLFKRVGRVLDIAQTHEEELADRFIDFILTKPNIKLFGEPRSSKDVRCATFSFVSEKINSAEISLLLAKDRIAVSSGHFYAKRLIERLGVSDPEDGVVRCSMAHYNTIEEVGRLIQALDKIL